MIRTLFLLSITGICTAPAAQIYSPSPAYSSREGEATSIHFGGYASARSQLGDGSLRGTGRQIKSISYRPSWSSPYKNDRTWRNVTLSVSEFDLSKMTHVATANVTGTPTQVFSGSVTWNGPTTWSSMPSKQKMAFPFRTAWSYSEGTAPLVRRERKAGLRDRRAVVVESDLLVRVARIRGVRTPNRRVRRLNQVCQVR